MDKKEIKLDKYDHSILWHLDVNARSSYTDIARAVRLSKQSVKLRIQRMESIPPRQKRKQSPMT